MSHIVKAGIFDLDFIATTKPEIRKAIKSLNTNPRASSVVFPNAHVVVESHWNPEFKQVLKNSTLIVPDGVPIAWLLHSLGQKNAERYSGPDLMMDLFAETQDKRHFFIGSTPEVLEKIKSKFKGNAAGFYSPPFTSSFSEEEKLKQLNMVNESQADYIWVGLGAPKQEKHVVEMASLKNSRGVWLAVGAAFDFYAGLKPRAMTPRPRT